MNHITKIIEEREELIDDLANLVGGEPADGHLAHDEVVEAIKSHNKTTILAVLEALEGEVRIRKIKAIMSPVNILENEKINQMDNYNAGYDRAMNETLDTLSDTLSLITLTKQEIL